jgi:hypothetical protein
MAFNARLVMTPSNALEVYDYGWCYASKTAALIAALGWDPNCEDEPPGWHKRATGPRRAPQRLPEAALRCVHGRYPGQDCDYYGCVPGVPAR